MSLYRKYRPQTFADVVGQEAVITTLENATEQDKLAHAYLFAGGRGTGKTSVARILAKNIMIRNIEEGRKAGVKGTPTFFVNGEKVQSGFDTLSEAIEDALGGAAMRL